MCVCWCWCVFFFVLCNRAHRTHCGKIVVELVVVVVVVVVGRVLPRLLMLMGVSNVDVAARGRLITV